MAEVDDTHPDDITEDGNYSSIRNQDYKSFKMGDVIIWHSDNFFRNYWNSLSEEDRIKYYGQYGYGHKKKKFFIYLSEISVQCQEERVRRGIGHAMIIDMDTEQVLVMVHPTEFRFADDSEF